VTSRFDHHLNLYLQGPNRLDAAICAILALFRDLPTYEDKRDVLRDLAAIILSSETPRNGGTRPRGPTEREDLAHILAADIRSLVPAQRSSTGTAASMIADQPEALERGEALEPHRQEASARSRRQAK
jgi:hypothetical protein